MGRRFGRVVAFELMLQRRLLPDEVLSEPGADELPQLVAVLTLLIDPDSEQRRAGLRQLVESGLHRRSQLAAGLLGQGVEEPNIALRREFVVAIAEVLAGSAASPQRVVEWLRHTLAQMRRRQIYGLLQISASSSGHAALVHLVLEQCSYSGGTLVQILQDRRMDIQIRVSAARAIEAIGYLDAARQVEVLENRIASRIAGQEDMGFVPSLEEEAALLLPALQEVSRSLAEAAK